MKTPKLKHLAILATLVLAAVAPAAKAQNTTNYYVETFDTDRVTGIWSSWFGAVYVDTAWDSAVNQTSPLQTNVTSGSMRLDYNFTANPDQAVFWNVGNITPSINGLYLTNFECDIKFDPTSPTNGNNTFGQVAFGSRGNAWGQPQFGNVQVGSTNAGNWEHVSFPISAVSQPAWSTLSDLFFSINTFGAAAVQTNVPGKLWFDNLQLSGLITLPAPPPPIMGIHPAKAGLRMFNRDNQAPWNAQGFSTVDTFQSWTAQLPGQNPAYTIDVQDWGNTPSSQALSWIFIPLNTAASVGSPFVGYFSTNTLTITIQNFITNFTANVAWKTNASAAGNVTNWNVLTNTVGVGKWTITWLSDTSATITPPGGSPVPFSIGADVASYMADPAEFIVSINPNVAAGYGSYLDLNGVYVTNVAGVNESDDFTKDNNGGAVGVVGAPGLWATGYSFSGGQSLVQVPSTARYWVTWTYPDVIGGYRTNLQTAPTITTPATNWYSPGYYANSNPVTTTLMGSQLEWTLLTVTNLPTANLTIGGPVSPTAYFRTGTNAPIQ